MTLTAHGYFAHYRTNSVIDGRFCHSTDELCGLDRWTAERIRGGPQQR